MKRKRPPKNRLKTGFAPLPVFTLEIYQEDGLLAEIPYSTEPIASEIQRIQRAGAIAVLIAMLMQRPKTEENFTNLADALGHDSADAVRRLAIGAGTDRYHCRLLDEKGRHIQTLHTYKPDYLGSIGNVIAPETIAAMARETAA